jgi:sec-independent protein translocase protein TatB
MLPQIGSTELLVIAAIALIVVGPKDLPMLLRKLGQFVARLRNMASDFRSSFDEMARQSELDDLRKEVAAMRDAAALEKSTIDSSMALVEDEIRAIDAATSEPAYTSPTPPDPYASEPHTSEPYTPEPYTPEPYAHEGAIEKAVNRRAAVAKAEPAKVKTARAPAKPKAGTTTPKAKA